MRRWFWVSALLACGDAGRAGADPKEAKTIAFKLQSAAFPYEGAIPETFTGDGADVSPALNWTGAPAGTKAFALVSAAITPSDLMRHAG